MRYSEGLTLRKCSINKTTNICCAKMLCKRALHNIWSVLTQHMLSDLVYKCWVGLDQHPVPIRTTYVVRNWFSLNICCVKMLLQMFGTTYWSTSPKNSYICSKCCANTRCCSKMLIKVTWTTFCSTYVVSKCCAKWFAQHFHTTYADRLLDQHDVDQFLNKYKYLKNNR